MATKTNQAERGLAADERIAFPIRVSPNKRYFVDSTGAHVFWLGTTQWELFRGYRLEEAQVIIEKTRAAGMVFAQVMLMGVGDGTKPNVYGHKPWTNDDPLTPNEEYFKNVDAVLELAGKSNLAISMTLYHQRYRRALTLEKARRWGAWLGARYKGVPHLVWSMTPEARPEFVPVLRELAAGLRKADGRAHLITFKPDPSPFDSSFIHHERWLDFNSMQTWKWPNLIYPMILADYLQKPVKPVLMAEGAYEAGTEYGFDVSPLWVRRQAYYSYLAGASHTYGHNDSWRVLPTWRQALDAPGAAQLGILRNTFLARPEWWRLVPDQSLLAKGGITGGDWLHLAARHKAGKWVIVYLADAASFSVRMSKLSGPGQASWIDPRTGAATAIGSFNNAGVQSFTTPEGWEDSLLILEST